jgi:flagellar biosynthesis anti-sigma factor FlgM|tara:strand:+ start:212 stop:538 length:327 start_codon:yes stop_codon:yes gene_type:complete
VFEMTDAINTQNRLQSTVIKSDTQPTAKKNTGSLSRSEENATAKSGAAAIVELSNSNVLQDLNTSVQVIPEVNAAKIETIKLAMTQGDYHPNAEVIAKKFSEIEKLLP